MTEFLPYAVFLFSIIVFIGFFNEKITHLTYEIALLLFSVIIGAVFVFLAAGLRGTTVPALLTDIRVFDINAFLMEGVLCFMLFAGSCHMKLPDFRRLFRPVSILAFVCTFLGAVFYGLLFFAASGLIGLDFTLPMCLMFGSIVAPTDPIAATSILSKSGLPRDTGFLMEGESLLNDGVGVALFVCFSGIVSQGEGQSFLSVMFREILGAVMIGTVITILFFILFKRTEDNFRRIFISLLNVSLAYWLCELFDCSGAIASVICGVLFFTLRGREEDKDQSMDLTVFDNFWEILDNLLNSVLYVILGVSFVRILQMPYVFILSLIAVVSNILARSGSLYVSTFLMGAIPDGLSRKRFVGLLTWGGLRGGLSIALAMSTLTILPDMEYRIVLGCTYAIVFFTTVVQGLTIKKLFAP